MQSGAALELVLACGLVIVPVRPYNQSCVRRLPCIHLLNGSCTYICLPPKIKRCCAGGMPSFSSTRSLMRETCGWRFVSQIVLVFLGRVHGQESLRESSVSRAVSYFVVRLNIELNLLAGQGAHSTWK
jgi:hypothetical protein